MRNTCIIEGCENPVHARQMCPMHYQRTRKNGSPHKTRKVGRKPGRRPETPETCTYQDCDRPHFAKGLCTRHYQKAYTTGSPDGRPRTVTPTYLAAHKVVTRARGQATWQKCVDCGRTALDWSLRYEADADYDERKGMYYSMDPGDYEPRCRSCHVDYDRNNPRGAELVE